MKTRLAPTLAALIVAIALCAIAQDTSTIKKELAALQGEWSMVSGSADGQSMPEQSRPQMKRVCKGNEVAVTMGTQMFLKATFTINPSTHPKTIDYEMTEGFTKGKKQLGIYELQGDTFRACFAAPGEQRPADFTSKLGDHRTLSVWARQKDKSSGPEQK